MRSCAISEIQIYQTLVRDALPLRHLLEILDSVLVEPNGDLLFKLRGIRIGLGVSEVIVITHDGTSHIVFFRASQLFGQK